MKDRTAYEISRWMRRSAQRRAKRDEDLASIEKLRMQVQHLQNEAEGWHTCYDNMMQWHEVLLNMEAELEQSKAEYVSLACELNRAKQAKDSPLVQDIEWQRYEIYDHIEKVKHAIDILDKEMSKSDTFMLRLLQEGDVMREGEAEETGCAWVFTALVRKSLESEKVSTTDAKVAEAALDKLIAEKRRWFDLGHYAWVLQVMQS
eukprot:gnl/TRDRNA2_/TRDRNA2_51505_c0_seq1.p1 gnl/TRDRNA2_/TRDRNA2_51505_c0~~gnl/TRDRNA2_/TRDRNA2_51505_c0_seq1.p1  ORF type:complete len:204 (+),score=47.57 gnl/TRDRNA2_/TRDRNA2_51505_c0_seq1:62-673(+)